VKIFPFAMGSANVKPWKFLAWQHVGTMVAERIANDVYGGFMQSALDALMGIASGAVGMLQQALNQSSPKSGFDDQLKSALAETTDSGKAPLEKVQSKNDSSSDDASIVALLANAQAYPLLQYVSILNSLGLSSADAQALLSGKGSDISDEGLKTILTSCGINDADITQLMADPNQVSGLKAKLAEMVCAKVHNQIGGDASDVNAMIGQVTADQTTYDTVAAQFIANTGVGQDLTKTLDNLELPISMSSIDIPQSSDEIKMSVAAFLQGVKTSTLKEDKPISEGVSQAETESVSSGQVVPEVQEALDTLENTLQIPKKTLHDLFFEQDSQVRLSAVDDAASHIAGSLKANTGSDLSKQVTGALGLLKGALTKDEFAKVEDVLKTSNSDPALVTEPFTLDKNTLSTLAKSLGSESALARSSYTDSVLDQIRQAIPGGMKSSDGSMTLKLNPPMLGRVDINIKLEDGQITASFKVDQSVTRDILQQNMHILKDALTDQGIKATQFVVTTDTFNSQDHRGNPLAWAGYEPGQNGSSRQQGNRQETGNPGRGQDEYSGSYFPVQAYSEQGGLDIFA